MVNRARGFEPPPLSHVDPRQHQHVDRRETPCPAPAAMTHAPVAVG
jgi:hypothetical protein